jgi:hypothetical protein
VILSANEESSATRKVQESANIKNYERTRPDSRLAGALQPDAQEPRNAQKETRGGSSRDPGLGEIGFMFALSSTLSVADDSSFALRPLAIDLYCGVGGWTEGLLAEGYRVISNRRSNPFVASCPQSRLVKRAPFPTSMRRPSSLPTLTGRRIRKAQNTSMARMSSKSDSRKAASAMIAKIPFPLAQHIARIFKP